ncbi:MAG: zinc ribbon domain-containing protein [Anaerolineae bacterium]|nr:zinc ribbon domain-containing protein [Anaerolineae bacterium]
MLIFLGIIIVGIAIAWVAYPIFRPSESPFRATEDSVRQAWEALAARRDDTLRAIKDLEFDYRVGKVSAEDFQVFRARLKMEAAAVMRQMDGLERESETALAADLEAEIAAARQAQRPEPAPVAVREGAPAKAASPSGVVALEKEVEQEIQQVRRRGAVADGLRACPRCGHAAAPDDRFCGNCGAALPEKAITVCPHCGMPRKPGDRFCAHCGKPLAAV